MPLRFFVRIRLAVFMRAVYCFCIYIHEPADVGIVILFITVSDMQRHIACFTYRGACGTDERATLSMRCHANDASQFLFFIVFFVLERRVVFMVRRVRPFLPWCVEDLACMKWEHANVKRRHEIMKSTLTARHSASPPRPLIAAQLLLQPWFLPGR